MRKIRLGYIGEVKNFKGTNEKLLEMFDVDEYDVKEDVDLTESHEKVYAGRLVFLVYNSNGVKKLYRLLPLVEDDELFKWEELTPPTTRTTNSQHLNAQVICGCLQFGINYYTTFGNVHIIVSALGLHSSIKAGIDHIWLNDGEYGNKEIREAIENYIANYKNKMDIGELKLK